MPQIADEIRGQIKFVETFATFESFNYFDTVQRQINVFQVFQSAYIFYFEDDIALKLKMKKKKN